MSTRLCLTALTTNASSDTSSSTPVVHATMNAGAKQAGAAGGRPRRPLCGAAEDAALGKSGPRVLRKQSGVCVCECVCVCVCVMEKALENLLRSAAEDAA